MLETIFREYDIRGKVGTELIIEEMYNLTRSIAYFFHEQRGSAVKTVAVGMDGRLHSQAIKEQVCKALIDSGLNVIFIGVCPSPVLYFALYNLPVDAGLMITASHNPKEDNGLKICLGKNSVWGIQVKEIKDLFFAGTYLESSKKGTITEYPIIDDYIAWMVNHFPMLYNMQLPVVIDCGNGAGGAVLPLLVKAMKWQHAQLLCAEIDGNYPNHEADPVKEKNMRDVKRALQDTDAQIGIGLDGDADRMVPMTKQGYLVPGDKLLGIFAQEIIEKNPGAAVVIDVKSSDVLLDQLHAYGAQSHLSPCGHAIIKDQMKKHNALLGGELSCHFFFKDRYFGYDDGIYAMLRLFELLNNGVSLEASLATLPTKYSSELLIPCAEDKKRDIVEAIKKELMMKNDVSTITIDGVRAHVKQGWGILRASNTQPIICLRCEADTPQKLQEVKKIFLDLLKAHVDLSYAQEQTGI